MKEHKNVEVVSILWGQVAVELNSTVIEVTRRFKNIRDTYVKELRKQANFQNSNPDGGCKYESNWALFKKLSFLKDVISQRRSKIEATELPKSLDEQTLKAMLENSALCEETSSAPVDNSSASLSPATFTWSADKRRKTDDSTNLCTQLASIGNQLLEENKYDPLEHFSLSLVPHLRRIPEHKLLQCQVQLLEVLVAYTDES